ncbi:MAG: hypothetical protein GY795_01385 [Desulfobacterales bacterium]|nr:hypothetical protein [Desulfobacterales bacterium]
MACKRKIINHNLSIIIHPLLLILYLFLFFPPISLASHIRIQTIQLRQGWNAVCLEVDPVNPDPDVVFANLPVTEAATYYPKTFSTQFIQDPTEKPWGQAGWTHWVPPSAPASVLNNLYSLHANQGFLIFCTADATWQVEGTPNLAPRKWQPESFNLTGFTVDPAAPPTFGQYFAGSGSHAVLTVYELVSNQWTLLENPAQVSIRPGRAYWIWCGRGENYPGPVALDLDSMGSSLNFDEVNDELSFDVVNHSSDPLTFSIEQIPNITGDQGVPLSLVTFDINNGNVYSPFSIYNTAASLEPGKIETVTLAVRRTNITAGTVTCLLKLADALGNVVYIPVTAVK